MKKWILGLVSLVLIVGLLGACSGSSSEGTGNGGGSSKSEDGKISGEITVWGWRIAAEAMQNAVPGFNEKYPNVKVNVQNLGQDEVYQKLTVGLGAGGSGLPDVVQVESNRIPSYVNQFPDGFVNLSEMGFDKYADAFAKSKVAVAKNKEGNFVAFPWDAGPVAVFYRTDYFKEANVDPSSIKTWDDFIAAGKKIKKATGVKLISLNIAGDDGIFRMMLNQQGIYYFNKEGKIVVSSDKAVKAMSKLKKMYDSGLIVNVPDWNGGIAAMKNGKVAAIPTGVWYSGTMTTQAPNLSGKWDVFLLPAFKEGGTHAANLGGSNLMIPASTDNKEAAYAFAKYYTTNVEPQMMSLKEKGLFPSLLKTYDNPYFDKKLEYFNNKPIFKTFAKTVEDIPPVNYTSDNAQALDILADAQASVLLEGVSPEKALNQAAQKLAQASGREIAK